MAWCEGQGVDYVFGLARNARLQKRIDKALRKSQRRCAVTGKAARRFREFRYRTLDSWSRRRRVVAKAEWLAGAGGGNPRFVVTSPDRQTRFDTYAVEPERNRQLHTATLGLTLTRDAVRLSTRYRGTRALSLRGSQRGGTALLPSGERVAAGRPRQSGVVSPGDRGPSIRRGAPPARSSAVPRGNCRAPAAARGRFQRYRTRLAGGRTFPTSDFLTSARIR